MKHIPFATKSFCQKLSGLKILSIQILSTFLSLFNLAISQISHPCLQHSTGFLKRGIIALQVLMNIESNILVNDHHTNYKVQLRERIEANIANILIIETANYPCE